MHLFGTSTVKEVLHPNNLSINLQIFCFIKDNFTAPANATDALTLRCKSIKKHANNQYLRAFNVSFIRLFRLNFLESQRFKRTFVLPSRQCFLFFYAPRLRHGSLSLRSVLPFRQNITSPSSGGRGAKLSLLLSCLACKSA